MGSPHETHVATTLKAPTELRSMSAECLDGEMPVIKEAATEHLVLVKHSMI